MQVRNARELGALLRRERTDRGWSQDALAIAAGVSRPTVIDVEAGKDTAHIGLVLRLLGALDLVVDVTANQRRGPTLGELLDDG